MKYTTISTFGCCASNKLLVFQQTFLFYRIPKKYICNIIFYIFCFAHHFDDKNYNFTIKKLPTRGGFFMVVDKTPLDLRFLNIFILPILIKRYSSNWSELVSIMYSTLSILTNLLLFQNIVCSFG